jgi:hypothetical protein
MRHPLNPQAIGGGRLESVTKSPSRSKGWLVAGRAPRQPDQQNGRDGPDGPIVNSG